MDKSIHISKRACKVTTGEPNTETAIYTGRGDGKFQ